MIQEDRALWKYIVFGFLTCGIYNFYFIYKMAQDVNEMCADDGKKTSGLVVFILLSDLWNLYSDLVLFPGKASGRERTALWTAVPGERNHGSHVAYFRYVVMRNWSIYRYEHSDQEYECDGKSI